MKKYWHWITVLNGEEDAAHYQQPSWETPSFHQHDKLQFQHWESPKIWQSTESFSGRKTEQPPLSIYQRDAKALRNTEMPSVNSGTLTAGSWPHPLPALPKPQQDHFQQFLLVPGLMKQLPSGKSLQQGWESSTPHVPPALWLKEHRDDIPLSLNLRQEQNQCSLSHHFCLSAISWWEWEAAFIWSLFCSICLRNGHQIKQKHRRASRLQNPTRQGLLLCQFYKQVQNS